MHAVIIRNAANSERIFLSKEDKSLQLSCCPIFFIYSLTLYLFTIYFLLSTYISLLCPLLVVHFLLSLFFSPFFFCCYSFHQRFHSFVQKERKNRPLEVVILSFPFPLLTPFTCLLSSLLFFYSPTRERKKSLGNSSIIIVVLPNQEGGERKKSFFSNEREKELSSILKEKKK